MPSKKAKKGSAKKPSTAGAVVNKKWEAGLTGAQFEEDSWQACVSLVVESSQEDEGLIQALALAVQQPKRKLFTLLTWDSTLAKIQELGNPKAKNAPLFSEVTESAKVLLDAGEEIPCDLIAKILKFQLLQIKANDQQRRKAEQAEDEKAMAGPSFASKEKRGASDEEGKSPALPVVPSNEKKTKLKRRHDVEPPRFIDDEPDDGPQHYILVLGFYQSHLIGVLDAIGVHVANVIKLSSEQKQTCEVQQEQHTSLHTEQSQRTSPVLSADSAGVEQAAKARRLDHFWSGLRPVLDTAPLDSKLHNVALLSYTVPGLLPSFHSPNREAVLELGSRIFDGIASLIYDSLNWRRQHQHYLDNIHLISVPTVVGLDFQLAEKSVGEESQPEEENRLPPLSADVDMHHYCNLLNLVPDEACSVPLILHCMLAQVVISTEHSVSTPTNVTENAPDGGPWFDCQEISYMLQSFLPLARTKEDWRHMLNRLLVLVKNEDNRKRLAEKFGSEKTQKKLEHPLVIRHHDKRTLRLRNISAVQGFDPAEVELSMMKLSPVWDLIHSVAHLRKRNSHWMAVKQQLQHFCTDDDVTWPEVERLFHQSVFETMPLTRVVQKGVLLNAAGPVGTLEPAQQQTPTIIPWDDPLSYAKQQLHNLWTKGPTHLTEDPGNTEQLSGRVCRHLDLSDIQSCRLRSLFDWHYAEHHDASVFQQVLQVASEEYRFLDTFRGSHNNTLYIFCNNPRSHHCQYKEFWDVAVHTDVKFRKYLDHVADKLLDWTREEESKEAMKLRNLSPDECPKDEKAADSSEDDSLEPVIRKGSLKAWMLKQEQLKEEELAKKSKKENTQKDKHLEEEARLKDNKRSKTMSVGKKSRAEGAGSSSKTPRESITTTVPPVEAIKDLHQTEKHFSVRGFTGYNMDGKLIHVSGCLQYLFPSDGGHITVENVSYVEGRETKQRFHPNETGREEGWTSFLYTYQPSFSDRPPQPHNKETNENKQDCKVSEPLEMKRVKQGSLSAVLNNGIQLSYSFYGPTTEYIVSPQEAEMRITEASTPVPITLSSTQYCRGKDQDSLPSKTHTSSQNRPQKSQSTLCEGQPALSSSPFSSLNLSLPNGLLLQFLREDTQGVSSEEQGVLVRQSFPLHRRGEVRELQEPSLSEERSRIVTSQGTVIRYMRDKSAEVLFADGSVSFSQDCGPIWVPDSEVEEENTPNEKEDNKKEQSSEQVVDAQRGCWLTTTPSGARICTVGTTHKHIPLPPLLTFKATDPVTHEVMLSREDLVVSVQNPDGSLTVEYADGTRITSLYKDKPPNKGGHPESVTLRATSECVCGCMECVCVTCCPDSINETMRTQDAFDTGEENIRDNAINASDKEDAQRKLSECECECGEKECAENTLCKNGEKSVFAEKAESGKRCACERDKGSVSSKEQVVLVEKEGYARVVMYPERNSAHVFLADGTVITGNNQGAYQVFPSSVGLLQIQSDGKCVYSSDPLVTPSPEGGTPTIKPGSYTFSHTGKVACDITDPDGNHFQVLEDGQISVLNLGPSPNTLKHEEEEEREVARLRVKHREHCPRLFLVHEDGSGTELLSSQTVEELLYQANSDPTIALLKEPLPDTRDEFAITILKPSHQSLWSQWILGKQNPDLTPPNLRDRSWHDFPRVEKKTPGPPFGTDMGRGLTLRERSGGSAAKHPPVRSCPKVLEIRELYQYQPFTTALKTTIDKRLKEYIDSLMEREQQSVMKVKDPRTEEESVLASDLLNPVLSFTEEEDADHSFDKRTSVDIGSLYSQGVGAKVEQSDGSEHRATVANESFTKGKESKWAEKHAKYRKELCEEKSCREALGRKNIVPYFNPENIAIYQNLLKQQTLDMRSVSMDLPPIPKSDSAEAFLREAPQENTPRPLKPTPSQLASHAAGSDKMPVKRATNRSPHAGESGARGSSEPYKSVQVDVTQKPRRTKVRLPTSILSSKLHREPNQQYLSVEEPVRRKCRTISLTDPKAVVRGFQLLPTSIDFGTLQEGTSSAVNVVMKNMGFDTCRFHVKQPPLGTGLRVIYNPGPVAAGLQVDLQVQLFAMCAVQAGELEPKKHISQDIIINTETDILYLPVTATILPEKSYDIWLKGHSSAHKKKGSRAPEVSSSLPGGRGVIHRRPNTLLNSRAAKTGHPNRTHTQ